MNRKFLAGLALFFFAGSLGTQGQLQQDSIQVGGVELRLGMAQDSVIQKFRDSYDVLGNAKDASSWMVVDKVRHQDAYGNLYFKDGKLAIVFKYWSVGEPNTEAGFAKTLFGALSGFEKEGRTDCTIRTGQSQNPSSETRAVFFVCGRKYLRMDIYSRVQGDESATVTEILEYPKPE